MADVDTIPMEPIALTFAPLGSQSGTNDVPVGDVASFDAPINVVDDPPSDIVAVVVSDPSIDVVDVRSNPPSDIVAAVVSNPPVDVVHVPTSNPPSDTIGSDVEPENGSDTVCGTPRDPMFGYTADDGESEEGELVNYTTISVVHDPSKIDKLRAEQILRLTRSCNEVVLGIEKGFEEGRQSDIESIARLTETAKTSGFETLRKYIEAAYDHLGQEERQRYEVMKAEVESLDEDMMLLHKVCSGFVAAAVILPNGSVNSYAEGFLADFWATQAFILFYNALCKSACFKSYREDAMAARFRDFAKRTLKLVPGRSAFSGETFCGVNTLGMGGRMFSALDTLLSIVEVSPYVTPWVRNPLETVDLKSKIVMLYCFQFVLKRIQLHIEAASSYRAAVSFEAILVRRNHGWLKKELITPKVAIEELARHMRCMRTEFITDVKEVTNREVTKQLKKQTSQGWTADYPNMAVILASAAA